MSILGKIMFCFVLFISVLLSGCTIKFRATDVELDTHSNTTYKFDGIELTRGDD